MSEFLVDIRNMELDEIDPADLAPIISSAGVPIITVPRDENDKDEDEDKDRDEDEDKEEDKDENEDEDEDGSMPGLQADKSSTEDLLGGSESDSEVGWRASRPENEEYDLGFDPSSNTWPREYRYHNSEPEDILERLDQQVKDLLKIMEVKMGWPAVYRYEDDVILTEGLENISVMEDKLSKIILSLKERINRAQRTKARILQLVSEDETND